MKIELRIVLLDCNRHISMKGNNQRHLHGKAKGYEKKKQRARFQCFPKVIYLLVDSSVFYDPAFFLLTEWHRRIYTWCWVRPGSHHFPKYQLLGQPIGHRSQELNVPLCVYNAASSERAVSRANLTMSLHSVLRSVNNGSGYTVVNPPSKAFPVHWIKLFQRPPWNCCFIQMAREQPII